MIRFLLVTACLSSGLLAAAPPQPTPAAVAAVFEELDLPVPGDAKTNLADDYQPDDATAAVVVRNPAKYPVRAAVLEAVKALKGARGVIPAATFVRTSDLDDPKKRRAIFDLQEKPALLIADLEEVKVKLDRADGKRKEETSKRWLAHLDLLRAEVDFRLALIHEYDLMLGHVRKENLPDLKPQAGEIGWRMAPAEKMRSNQTVRALATSAKDRYKNVLKRYPKTPWAALAEIGAEASPGLKWEAYAEPADQ